MTHPDPRLDAMLAHYRTYLGDVLPRYTTQLEHKSISEAAAKFAVDTYAVRSLARDERGVPYKSYRPIERMAVAAYVAAGRDPRKLESLRSSDPEDHNPAGIEL